MRRGIEGPGPSAQRPGVAITPSTEGARVYVNGPAIGAEAQLPFGGVKDTGSGHRDTGKTGLDIFTEWKTVDVDDSGRLQKAPIDTAG